MWEESLDCLEGLLLLDVEGRTRRVGMPTIVKGAD